MGARLPPKAMRLLFSAAALLAGVTGHSARAETVPAVEIDRIEVTGVTAFGQPEIEGALEVSPGDRLERARVARTAENLQELYRFHGYERATVRSQLGRRKSGEGSPETVLEFVVAEGKPTRVASIRITPESLREDAFRRYWSSLETELAARAGLAPGDVYDQEKLAAGKRAAQELLASEEFVGASVAEVKVSEAPVPAGASGAGTAGSTGTAGKDAARWVALEYQVHLGDRVSFGFRGNTVFTQARLSALVDEQRVLGFGKDYIGAIRGRIEEEYRASGYARSKITPYTIERPENQERHVTFVIEEGPRFTLESVAFDGNMVFSQAELRAQFYERASSLIQHGYYAEKDAQNAAELVVEWMKAKGYLAAKLVTVTQLSVPKAKRARAKPAAVRLVVYLYEGDQTTVGAIRFEGASSFSAAELRSVIGAEEGQPLNLFAFSEGLESLKAAYRSRGYLGARIANEGTDSVVRYSDENRRADIRLEIVEGPEYVTSSIQIDGLDVTRESVVRRELQIKEGAVLSETALTETEARLRRLGLFSTVTIRLTDDPARADAKIVRIILQEGTPGVIAGGPGYRNDFGVRLFGQVAYNNLWGLNHTLSFTANANHRIEGFRFVEYQAQLAYIYPWFLQTDVTFRPSITATGNQFILFDATTLNAALTWEKRLLRDPALTGLLTYSVERVHQFNALSKEDERELRIGAIIPALRLDTRDNPLNPTTGWFGTLSYEVAAPWLLSQSGEDPLGYSRIQGRLDRLFVLPFGVTWFISYRGGFERSSEPDSAIPLIKQFALGGAGSLRGYREQELNRQDLSIRGTLSYSNYRTQLDVPVAGALKVGPFLDAANLLVDNRSIGMFLFDQLLYGAGVGFHYQTPVGPVNLDWGYKLNPRPNDPERARFYFSIGFI